MSTLFFKMFVMHGELISDNPTRILCRFLQSKRRDTMILVAMISDRMPPIRAPRSGRQGAAPEDDDDDDDGDAVCMCPGPGVRMIMDGGARKTL